MLDYMNGKTSDHMSPFYLSIAFGVLIAYAGYLIGRDPIALFLLTTAGMYALGGALGWAVSKFTGNQNHIVATANWYILMMLTLRLTEMLLLGEMLTLTDFF